MAQRRGGHDLLGRLNQRFSRFEGKAAQQHGARRDGLGRRVRLGRFVEKTAGQKTSGWGDILSIKKPFYIMDAGANSYEKQSK